ncbi:MAG: guanylate kinase [Dehalococcoidia bacterium]|nr:guanylate kinase [Dehalococcoidia bacterium]
MIPLLVVITGPSGVGKDTLVRELKRKLGDSLHVAVTATTRPPRPGERHGVHYYFLSQGEFEDLIRQGGLLEHATVYGHRYGVPKAPLREALSQGKDVVVRVDVQGGQFIKSHYPEAVTIFLLPPSEEELARRLRGRGQDDPQQVALRLLVAQEEMAQAQQFDYQVVNDQLEEAVEAVLAIMARERAKPGRRPPSL